MIIRIVKMTFSPEKVDDFLKVFEASKSKIRNFEDCTHLDLLQDINDPSIFFTYSIWQSEEHLNKYRDSELFSTTWAKTKILFAAKPEAWTVNKFDDLKIG